MQASSSADCHWAPVSPARFDDVSPTKALTKTQVRSAQMQDIHPCAVFPCSLQHNQGFTSSALSGAVSRVAAAQFAMHCLPSARKRFQGKFVETRVMAWPDERPLAWKTAGGYARVRESCSRNSQL